MALIHEGVVSHKAKVEEELSTLKGYLFGMHAEGFN